MAVTLMELAMVQKDDLYKAIILDLLRQSDLLNLVSIEDVPGMQLSATRWQTLPTVATRKLNGTYTPSTGTLDQVAETLSIYGGEITVDRVARLNKNVIEDPYITQTKMKVRAMATKFNLDFINGDHAWAPDGFEGLKKRVANAPARMTIAAGASDTLKVLTGTGGIQTFLDCLHNLVYVTGANALLMNEAVKLGVGQILRRAGLLDTTKDNYERTWETFAGAKLIDVGLQADQSTEIITSTETAIDAGADSTSIYGVRFDGDDGLRVLQLQGTSPLPMALGGGEQLEASPVYASRIDWVIGLQQLGRYSVGRLYNFTLA